MTQSPDRDRLEEMKRDCEKWRDHPQTALSSFTVERVGWLIAEVERLRTLLSERDVDWRAVVRDMGRRPT